MKHFKRSITLWFWRRRMNNLVDKELKKYAKDGQAESLFKVLTTVICIERAMFKFSDAGKRDKLDYIQYSLKRNQTQYIISCKTTMQN